MTTLYTRTVLTVAFLAINISLIAQPIPNPSFESWTGGNPDGWYTLNGSTIYVTQSNDAHEGSSAALSSAMPIGAGFNAISPMYSGSSPSAPYFYCNCRPDALHFWYKVKLGPNETFTASIGGTMGGVPHAGGTKAVTASTNVYTEGVVNITYNQAGNADSMSISFAVAGSGGLVSDTSSYLVDDLSWESAVNVHELSDDIAVLESISPNPVSNSANIVYNLMQSSDVQLSVYDATGRLIKQVLHELQLPGRYKAIQDFSMLNSGIYSCRLTVDGQLFTKSFVVTQ